MVDLHNLQEMYAVHDILPGSLHTRQRREGWRTATCAQRHLLRRELPDLIVLSSLRLCLRFMAYLSQADPRFLRFLRSTYPECGRLIRVRHVAPADPSPGAPGLRSSVSL